MYHHGLCQIKNIFFFFLEDNILVFLVDPELEIKRYQK